MGNGVKMNACNISSEATGMPFYDSMLKNPEYYREKGLSFEVRYMSPDDYMQKSYELYRENVKKLTGLYYPKTYEEYLSMVIDKKRVDEYLEKMKKGIVFPMPILDCVNLAENGRHRAMASKKFGCKKIPVMVVVGEGKNLK